MPMARSFPPRFPVSLAPVSGPVAHPWVSHPRLDQGGVCAALGTAIESSERAGSRIRSLRGDTR